MTPLERHCRVLLHAYPARYRHQRADEFVTTLLETTPPSRTWPMPRDGIALLSGALRARSGQNQRLRTSANLRLAALLGCSVYLVFTAVSFALYGLTFVLWHHVPTESYGFGYLWSPFIVALLILAAALLPWLCGRNLVALGALMAAAAAVAFLFTLDYSPWFGPGDLSFLAVPISKLWHR